MATDLDDEQQSLKLRQRLWGAAVLIAIAVIVLPLILDGAGSESQFRRVERLREEPPRVIDEDGNSERVTIPDMRVSNITERTPGKLDIRIGEDDPPDYMKDEETIRDTLRQRKPSEPLSAWVVQAGSYREEVNAVAVRDRLRRAGYPSFVTESDSGGVVFRVQVGPMIDQGRAEYTRDKVEKLLGRGAIVMSYP